jgi:RNA polymerase sigma-70 factor (ECF subfamily)
MGASSVVGSEFQKRFGANRLRITSGFVAKIIPNNSTCWAVFMSEGIRVAVGQVTLSGAMALARTEEDLLELAVREHARMVYRIAYSVLRNHQDAEDATQETFVRVLRARRKLATVDDPQRWLARIAWRVAVERKKNSPEISLEETDGAVTQLRSTEMPADEVIVSREVAEALERLVPALPHQLRDVVTLSTVGDMSPTDVAAVLEISEAAVRSRLFRARQILREKLGVLLEGRYGT